MAYTSQRLENKWTACVYEFLPQSQPKRINEKRSTMATPGRPPHLDRRKGNVATYGQTDCGVCPRAPCLLVSTSRGRIQTLLNMKSISNQQQSGSTKENDAVAVKRRVSLEM